MNLEERYSPPRVAKTAMYDLYALYAMWYAKGGGRTAYAGGGFEQGAPTNELRRERIEDMFEASLMSQAQMLINMLIKAIPAELSAMYDEHLVDWKLVERDLAGNPSMYERVDQLRQTAVPKSLYDPAADMTFQKAVWAEFTVMEIHKLFCLPLWKDPQCDQYGGQKWAQIVETFGRLIEAYKAHVPKTLMYWVDRVYDLEHNNGSIMSKAPKSRRVSKEDLDYRANAKLDDFMKVTSPIVAQMIPSCMAENRASIVSKLIEEDDTPVENLVEFFLESQTKLNPTYLKP